MKRQITTVLSIIILLAAFLGSASLAGIIPVARAATITVQSTADGAANAANCPGVNCRLRDAIAKATSGDAIDFDATVFSTERTITMTTDEIMIDKTLTIDASAVARVTISGSGVRRIFNLDHNSVTLTLKNLTLTNGRCYVQGCDGGAIYTYQGTVKLNNVTISYSKAEWRGGGIYAGAFATINATDTTFSHNTADSGGAIYSMGTSTAVTLITSTVYSNTAISGYGGGVDNDGVLRVDKSTFSENWAGSTGGGISNLGIVTATQSTFTGNIAWYNGGGIGNNNVGKLTATNCTFENNRQTWTGAGDAGGGAISNKIGANTATVKNSTFANNSGYNGGAIFNYALSAITLINTIVANSTAGGNCVSTGTLTDGGGNLRWPSSDASCVGTFGDPKLGALADYGGPTHTVKPGSDSAAIDEADPASCPTVDQRDAPRGDLRCDIGAVELKLSDTNWVQKVSHAQGDPFSFGPTRVRLTRTTSSNPGTVTVAKADWAGHDSSGVAYYWDISPSSSPYQVTLSICYLDSEVAGLDESNLKLYRYTGSAWEDKGGTVDTVNNCVTATGVTALSRWTIATGMPSNAPTAVTLVAFWSHSLLNSPGAYVGIGAVGLVIAAGFLLFVAKGRWQR